MLGSSEERWRKLNAETQRKKERKSGKKRTKEE